MEKNINEVTPKTASEKLGNENAILLDVRTDQELKEMSVDTPKLKHISLQSLGNNIDSLPKDAEYYTLCRSGKRATAAAEQLKQNGFENVNVIKGGIIAWKKAGLEVKKGPISLERQVRIIAGSLVLAGVLLSLLNPWFLLISAFVGCGLVFAGITDNCMMGILLMKLPYNKSAIPCASCSLDKENSAR